MDDETENIQLRADPLNPFSAPFSHMNVLQATHEIEAIQNIARRSNNFSLTSAHSLAPLKQMKQAYIATLPVVFFPISPRTPPNEPHSRCCDIRSRTGRSDFS